jgi:hypothetical protein
MIIIILFEKDVGSKSILVVDGLRKPCTLLVLACIEDLLW